MLFRTLGNTCVFSIIVFGAQNRSPDADRIGVYHWGGQLTSSMSAGIERIASLGGHVARVAYSPRYYSDYGIQAGCYPDYSLSRLAQEPDVQRALDNRDIHVFILTAYDGVTFGDCWHQKFFVPGFYINGNIAALKAEYSDFVVYLFQRYANSGRRFIISNWEGDNAVYCGAAYSYAVDPSVRAECDANYPTLYEGNNNLQQSLVGFGLWLQAREAGIADGLARAQQLGLSGFEVLHAPEINIVRTLEKHGFPSVLRNALSAIHPVSISYSSYESLGSDDPGETLATDIATIRAVTGAPGVIVGEATYSRSDNQNAGKIMTALEAALKSSVDYFIYWNLNDQDSANKFGLFDLDNHLTPAGEIFERVFRNIF